MTVQAFLKVFLLVAVSPVLAADKAELAKCAADYAKRPGITSPAQAREICEAPSEGGRECLYENFVGQKG